MNLPATPAALDFTPQRSTSATARPLLLCLSHLRWGFVYQRPQHVMSRLAQAYEVLFWEEPVFSQTQAAHLVTSSPCAGVTVMVPHLPEGLDAEQIASAQRQLVDAYLQDNPPAELLMWYLTPMSLSFTEHLQARVTVFDCMDELSAFKGAPPELVVRERQLLAKADVVFTGGHSLWQAKRQHHDNAHSMPSSVDIAHFAQARQAGAGAADQRDIPEPRLGFFGVIDERFDSELIRDVAAERPQWQIVLIGPVVKIDPASLPQAANIHYLGARDYRELPSYLAGWAVALMPFAINESTRFISPTKTPEYLAGGCPVVSTPVRDVVDGYGASGVVHIAATAPAFIAAIDVALQQKTREDFLSRADAALEGMSWDTTCGLMKEHIECLR